MSIYGSDYHLWYLQTFLYIIYLGKVGDFHMGTKNCQNFTHQNKTTLFWRKKAKINLHQNFPIYATRGAGNANPSGVQ
jgi:hypothetical protein